jgi:hypothetical protein
MISAAHRRESLSRFDRRKLFIQHPAMLKRVSLTLPLQRLLGHGTDASFPDHPLGLYELQAIAEDIVQIRAPLAGHALVEARVVPGGSAAQRNVIQVVYHKSHVSLPCWTEVFINTKMDLDIVELEPNASSRSQHRRFLNFPKPQHVYIEPTSLCFSPAGHG